MKSETIRRELCDLKITKKPSNICNYEGLPLGDE